MSTNQERAHELFIAARNLPSAERDPFLDKECGEDDALRAEAESLLCDYLMQAKTIDSSQPSSQPITTDAIEHIPERWKISSGVKSGGMGSVYDARDTVLNRRVAIKLLHQISCYCQFVHRFPMRSNHFPKHPRINKSCFS